jgi:hypothetical protein
MKTRFLTNKLVSTTKFVAIYLKELEISQIPRIRPSALSF